VLARVNVGEHFGLWPGSSEEIFLGIETKTQGELRIIKVTGRLSMGPELDRFNAALDGLLSESHNNIILDFEEVPTIDSSAIGVLVRHLTTTKKIGGSIKLLKPTKFVVQTLKMVGLLNLFPTYEDLPQALASFQ
jgi:anti-sigma B factor antagonist